MRSRIIAGFTLDFTTDVPDFLPADGWTLRYRLTPISAAGTVIEFSAVTEGDHYRVQIPPNTTRDWGAGEYAWTAWVDVTTAPGSEMYPVDEGSCTVAPDPTAMPAGTDSRSMARRALADAEAAMASFQSSGGRVKRYAIAGREMEFDAAADLLKLISYWRAEVMREDAADARAKGLADPRRIYLRMGRA